MKNQTEIISPKNEKAPKQLRGILQLLNRLNRDTGEVGEITPARPRSFNPDRIVHPAQPEGGRSLEVYEGQLQFDRQALEGKRVLDLGSGPEVKFAADLEEAGINAEVVSLSPDYSTSEYADRANKFHDKNLIAGVGEALPFKNESFDRVFALHTHPHIINLDNFLTEVARVLAPGGEARIGPDVTYESIYDYLNGNEQLQEQLAEQGIKVERNPIPREVFTTKQIDPGGNRITVGGNVVVLMKDPRKDDHLPRKKD